MKFFLLIFTVVTVLIACSEEIHKDSCNNVECSNHGSCVVNNKKAVCSCDAGYYAEKLECLKSIEDVYNLRVENIFM